jgi:hypothetical protein
MHDKKSEIGFFFYMQLIAEPCLTMIDDAKLSSFWKRAGAEVIPKSDHADEASDSESRNLGCVGLARSRDSPTIR